MTGILLIGTIPPPVGGVSTHIKRFYDYAGASKEFQISLWDIKKGELYSGGNRSRRFFRKFKVVLQSDIVHLHLSNKLKVVLACLFKLMFKKVVYTHHNSILESKFILSLLFLLCDRIILVNKDVLSSVLRWRFIDERKFRVIPAFIPPLSGGKIEQGLRNKIDSYKYTVATNCFSRVYVGGKETYGFDVFLDAIKILEQQNRASDTLFLFVDPSGTYHDEMLNFVGNISHKSEIFYYKNPVDFTEVIKLSTVTVRATRTDGDSLSVRESLYLGKSIIASDCAHRPEGTILFQSENSDELASKIHSVISGEVENSIDHRNFAGEVVELYKQLCKGL